MPTKSRLKAAPILLWLITAASATAEPTTLWQHAQQAAEPKKTELELPETLLPKDRPLLVKVIIDHQGKATADIYYRGGLSSYQQGDKLPSGAIVGKISQLSVSLSCKVCDSEWDSSELHISGFGVAAK